MEDLKKEKEAALMKKFEAMKQKHQEENAPEEVADKKEKHTGIIPNRNFKKNLGCG